MKEKSKCKFQLPFKWQNKCQLGIFNIIKLKYLLKIVKKNIENPVDISTKTNKYKKKINATPTV